MRFAILVATAALGMSAPAGAATWVFDVTGDFTYNLVEYLNVGNPGGIPQMTFTQGVERVTYALTIDTGPAVGVDVKEVFTLVGKSSQFRPGQGLYTNWRIENGQAYFDSASFYADSFANSPCAGGPGPIDCYNFSLSANAQNLTANFVSSSNGPGPVPEPATWAMMIVGFGMVGGTLRALRTKTARVRRVAAG